MEGHSSSLKMTTQAGQDPCEMNVRDSPVLEFLRWKEQLRWDGTRDSTTYSPVLSGVDAWFESKCPSGLPG
jgi:hypothetical protein